MSKRSADDEPARKRKVGPSRPAKPRKRRPAAKPAAKLRKRRPAAKPAAKPHKRRPAAKPAVKPRKRRPAAKPAVKPRKPRKRPAAKPAAKPRKRRPAAKPATKPRKRRPVAKPATKPRKRRPVAKPTAKPRKRRPVAKPTAKPRKRRPAAKPATKPRKRPGKPTVDQAEAIAVITDRLEMAQARLSEMSASVKVYPMPSGPVDGELLVQANDDTDGEATFRLMMEAFTEMSVNSRNWSLYWVALGLNYYLAPSETAYRRWRGLDQVQTNYQKANRANILEEILIVTHSIIPGMRQKRDLGVHSVFVRLHWNSADEQPKR